jgi:AcrR family transcriptional regulator
MTPKGDSHAIRGRAARGGRSATGARDDKRDFRGARADKHAADGGKREYRSDKRESDAAKTRSRIVTAAVKHLRSAKGMKGLSLESVAKEAGVTRLTVYKQFGSRRGLLEAVFDDVARRGGLHRIPEAMAEHDPRVALQRLVSIFCEFWYFNSKMLGQIIGASVVDPQLERAILARNERRRKGFATLLNRIADANKIPPETFEEVVDTLFVLTSHAVFSGLAVDGRSVETVCRLVQDLAIRTVDRLEV